MTGRPQPADPTAIAAGSVGGRGIRRVVETSRLSVAVGTAGPADRWRRRPALLPAPLRALARRPRITVPTIVLDPTEDPKTAPQGVDAHRERFTALVDHRLVPSGHDMPHDAPDAVAAAVRDLHGHVVA